MSSVVRRIAAVCLDVYLWRLSVGGMRVVGSLLKWVVEGMGAGDSVGFVVSRGFRQG